TVKFWHGEGRRFYNVKTDKVLGCPKNVHRTVALDIAGLVQLLTLPRQLRKDNCYSLKLLKLQQATSLKPFQPVSKSYSDRPDLSWIHVANGSFGLDLVWQPPQKYAWTDQFIRTASQSQPALYLELAPGFDLQEKIIIELKKAASETRAFLPDGWKQLNLQTQEKPVEAAMASKPVEAMDAMLPMILQKEVLDAPGNSPDKEQPQGSQDEGETLVENVVGDIVETGDSVMDSVKSAVPGL
ncbi:MAG: hypothetical protein Q9192_007175, partial [Flavoplaca navasiana]